MSPEGIEIRPATEADVETLFGLIGELASFEKRSDEVTGTPELLRHTLFVERAAEALLVEEGGEAIGYAIFYVAVSSFECRSGIWLEDLYVRPARRHGGVGRALMEHLSALAVERGHSHFEWSALEWNAPALEFYAGLGAEPHDGWRTLRLGRAGMERLAAGASGAGPAPK